MKQERIIGSGNLRWFLSWEPCSQALPEEAAVTGQAWCRPLWMQLQSQRASDFPMDQAALNLLKLGTKCTFWGPNDSFFLGEDTCQGTYEHNCALQPNAVCLGGFLTPESPSGIQCPGSQDRICTTVHTWHSEVKKRCATQSTEYICHWGLLASHWNPLLPQKTGRKQKALRSGASSVLWSQTSGP